MEIQCPCCSTKLKKIKCIELNLEIIELILYCLICKQTWTLTNLEESNTKTLDKGIKSLYIV